MLHELLARWRRPFARNLAWLGGAEAAVRVTRLVAAVALAHRLDPVGFGLAALALAVHELFFVVARQGLGTYLVQCSATELEAAARTVNRAAWGLGWALALLQAATGWLAAKVYGEEELVPLVAALALVHLTTPFGLVSTALLRRENRLRSIAAAQVATVGTDNLLTAALALGGAGAWAIVLPKILSTPIWVAVVRWHLPWRPRREVKAAPWRPIFTFARRVLGSELLEVARNQLDYVLVGRLLGTEALGVYYFAFNAGLGFAFSVIRSFADSLYPHLCAAGSSLREMQVRLREAGRTIATFGVPLILLQCALAPLYVPLVFGERWREAVPLVVLTCLSAIPRLFGVGASQLLRALGRPELELRFGFGFTCLLGLTLTLGTLGGLPGVAAAVLATHAVALPLYAWGTLRLLHPPAVPA